MPICQKLPKVAKSCQKFPQVAKSCQTLPQSAKSCQKVPKVATSWQKLPQSAKSWQKLPQAAKSDGKVVFAPQNKQILGFCLTFPSFEHKLHSTVQLKMCKISVKTVLHTLYSFKILNAEALLKLLQHFEIV